MALKGISSRLSTDGTNQTPTIVLMKGQTDLETLRLVRAQPGHRNNIIATWLNSYRDQARKQGLRRFYAESEPAIAESRWSDCWVLTDDGGFTVHGWVCAQDGKLWHCYVVPELRRLRLATRMIEHACPDGLKEYARPWPYGAHAQVNPYLLRSK